MTLQQQINMPIIVSGYSGSGKDTVSNYLVHLCKLLNVKTVIKKSHCRYTDRKRRPEELDILDGFYVSKEEFLVRSHNKEFLYEYQKKDYGDISYGFSKKLFIEEIKTSHLLLNGGEPHTALELYKVLYTMSQEYNYKKPIIIMINTLEEESIHKHLEARSASSEEKALRNQHVQGVWEVYPKAFLECNDASQIHIVYNSDIEKSVLQMLSIITMYEQS